MRIYLRFLSDAGLLWQRQMEREASAGGGAAAGHTDDRRFSSPAWASSPFFDFMRQYYLLAADFVTEAVDAAELPPHEKGQMKFFARQYVDAMAPSNFVATNPEALSAALQSQGETLRHGIEQLLDDVFKGRISTVDESAFEVGRNLATTPGDVVFENELIQLIQYRASTARVHRRPLLIVPPCINKFYILDLSPENSFIRFALDEGHTVFVVSWRNPAKEPPAPAKAPKRRTAAAAGAERGIDQYLWDDYIEHGALAAIRTVQSISGSESINALGFCVGGTLLSSALAVLAARGERPVASLTLLATLLDFSDTGEIGFFVDEASVAAREAMLGEKGILEGRELAAVFSALRDNDLIWSYVVNNYLKGQKPAAFDILYWNADSTNLPGPMYCWYLRHMYLANALREPGRLTVCGERIDLGAIGAPAYIVGTREDHIVPWRSAYASTQLLKPRAAAVARGQAPVRFILGASGHIAGIVNPALKNRRSYWVGSSTPADPDRWLAAASEQPGSWWKDWARWLAAYGGGMKAAPRTTGGRSFRPIEPAPGRYVRAKAQ
jgi:polyhydroxyalkanoate synthase